MRTERVEADVLCVGGGIAGLMAAIRASELGAKVLVAEKGNCLSSGCGRAGNDHIRCYIPEIHGPDIESIVRSEQTSVRSTLRDARVVRTRYEKSFDIVKLWDEWGIPMKHQGKYEFAGQGYPGGKLLSMKYYGQAQKSILTKQALNRGTKIMNRIMVFELLGSADGVTGALGVDTREDRLIEFQAKSVILATGHVTRLYPGVTPALMGNGGIPFTLTGDGRAISYRLGAELIGLEMTYEHCGPKYFAREGQGTWVGVVRDPQGMPIGPFVTNTSMAKRYGDAVLMRYPTLFQDYARSGRGPIYMDCTGISDEDYEYMMLWLKHEGNVAVLKHLEEEGVDLRKNPVEFMRYEIRLMGGVDYNEKAETSVKGLYAAGDEIFGGICNAAVFGYIAGENAAGYAKESGVPELEDSKAKIEEKRSLLSEIKSREVGADWREANFALQQVMNDYAGSIRSQTLLEAGLNHLRRLKEKACSTLIARNQWELIRCLEVLNLFDLGELIFITANERRETRGAHIRPDYPVTNPQLDKSVLSVKKVNGKTVTRWRTVES